LIAANLSFNFFNIHTFTDNFKYRPDGFQLYHKTSNFSLRLSDKRYSKDLEISFFPTLSAGAGIIFS
jgi:hypothetical protein